MKPNNPFLIAGYHSPNYFCDREYETTTLVDALHNGRNVTLIAPRRIGKTGLIQHLFYKQREQDTNVVTVYIKPIRFTDEFLKEDEYFTVSFFDNEYKAALGICGTKSGRDYDKVKDLEIMKYVDVLIDGRFILKQFNPNLKWRGSANQRIILVQETRKQGHIVLHPDNNIVTEFFPEQAFDPCKDMTPQEIKEKYIDNPCSEGDFW